MTTQWEIPEIISLHHISLGKTASWITFEIPDAGHSIKTSREDKRLISGHNVLDGPDDIAMCLPHMDLFDLTSVKADLGSLSFSS